MRITIKLRSRYRNTYCEFCKRTVNEANPWLPNYINEIVKDVHWWGHKRTGEHRRRKRVADYKRSRLAPALQIDPEALERRKHESRTQ